jgi:hypothetical protein
MKQTESRETINVVIDYKGNNHTVTLKMLNPTSTIEFYQLLIPKVNFLLTNKYPEETINFNEVRHNTPNELIINRSIAAKKIYYSIIRATFQLYLRVTPTKTLMNPK